MLCPLSVDLSAKRDHGNMPQSWLQQYQLRISMSRPVPGGVFADDAKWLGISTLRQLVTKFKGFGVGNETTLVTILVTLGGLGGVGHAKIGNETVTTNACNHSIDGCKGSPVRIAPGVPNEAIV
jgi:hypothetical protein